MLRPLGSSGRRSAVGLAPWLAWPVVVWVAQACATGKSDPNGNTGTATWTTSTGGGGSTSTSSGGSGGGGAGVGGVAGGGGAGGSTTTTSSTTTTTTSSTTTTTSSSTTTTSSTTGSGGGGAGGAPPVYSHTIDLADNGVNDFVLGDERFVSSSVDGDPNPPDNSYYGFFAWDATYLFVGMQGPDVASNDANKLVLVYLDGSQAPKTATGYQYNTQKPNLPFAAHWHVRWATSNGDTKAYAWNGSTWQDALWDFAGDVYQTGTYVEMRIPLADLGQPDKVQVHLCMINKVNGGEWTYGAVPSTSLVDGYNPSYGKYFGFDLGGAGVPTSHVPQ